MGLGPVEISQVLLEAIQHRTDLEAAASSRSTLGLSGECLDWRYFPQERESLQKQVLQTVGTQLLLDLTEVVCSLDHPRDPTRSCAMPRDRQPAFARA